MTELGETIKLIAEIVGIITITVGIWKSLYEYRLKVKAETLNAHKVEIELEIALIKHFTDLMDTANGKGKSEISHVLIEKYFSEGLLTDGERSNTALLKEKLDSLAIFNMPVGAAAQTAAIAAIGVLGINHQILKVPAAQFLSEIKNHIPVAEMYYNEVTK